MIRLAVLSDIHGNSVALDAVLGDLDQIEAIDYLWILGDIAPFGPRPVECIHRVREICDLWGDKAHVISGNGERYMVTGARRPVGAAQTRQDLDTLASDFRDRDLTINWALNQLSFEDYAFLHQTMLTPEPELEIEGYGLVAGYHGSPGNDEGWMNLHTPDEEISDLLAGFTGRMGFGGHTHAPMDRQVGEWRVINVGSVGAARARRGAEYVIITFDGQQPHLDFRIVPYDLQVAITQTRQCGAPAPEWMIRKMQFVPHV